jgi:hypothetical protein
MLSPGLALSATIPQEGECRVLKSRIAALLLLVAMFTAPLVHAQGSRAQSEIALRQLEQELVDAASRNDWRFWDRVVASEWTFVDQFGGQWDKPAALTIMKNFKGSIHSVRLYDVQVRFFRDDVAMVRGITTAAATVSGKVFKTKNRSTDILVYRQGKWLVVASQTTPVKDIP